MSRPRAPALGWPALAVLPCLAACAEPAEVVPVSARVAGSALSVALSDGRGCTLPLPPDRRLEIAPPADCRPVGGLRVHPAPAPGEPVVLIQFDGEGQLQNDGAPLWVWVGIAGRTWLFAG